MSDNEESGAGGGGSLPCARHAVVEFSPEGTIRLYHCVFCDVTCPTSAEFLQHSAVHRVSTATTRLHTTATTPNGASLEHTNAFMLHHEHVPMKIKLEPDFDEGNSDQEEAMQTYDGTTEDEEDSTNQGEDLMSRGQCFLCTQCRMPFSDLLTLQEHIVSAHNEGKKGSCSICGKFFPKLSDLDRHTLLEHAAGGEGDSPPHATPLVAERGKVTPLRRVVLDKMEYINDPSAERRYRCKLCGSLFKLRHHCSDHIKAIHHKLSYPCEVCNKKYKSKRALKMHLLDHQDQGVVTTVEAYHRCQICKKAFKRRHQFENHVRVQHGTMLFPCHLCDKRFKHEELLHSHLQNHDETYKFKCQICQISFSTVKDRQVHTAVHTGDIKVELADGTSGQAGDDGESIPGVPVICSICGLTFSSDDALKVHCIKDHNDPIVFSCNNCSEEHESFLDLLNHIKQYHRTQQQLQQQQQAGGRGAGEGSQPVFPAAAVVVDDDDLDGDDGSNGEEENDTSLNQRIFTKVVDDETPVPEEFVSARRSSRNKKFKCADCGHTFGYLHHLKDHRNSFHTGVIYSCKKCGKQYKRKNSMREHTCEKAMCHICNRPFQYKGHLVKHMQQFHNARPSNGDIDESMEEDNDTKPAHNHSTDNGIQLELVQDDSEDAAQDGSDEQQDIKPIILPGFIME